MSSFVYYWIGIFVENYLLGEHYWSLTIQVGHYGLLQLKAPNYTTYVEVWAVQMHKGMARSGHPGLAACKFALPVCKVFEQVQAVP
jgi:hypothetical protein